MYVLLILPNIGGWFKNSFQAYARESLETVLINGKPITTTIDVGIKATKTYVSKALGGAFGNAAKQSLTNAEVRLWYNNQLKSLNTSVPFTEANALALNTERNLLKVKARGMMADRETATLLEKTEPIRPFNYYVQKYSAQGYSGENLWQRIIQGSSTPNAGVNARYGIK